MVMIDCLHVSTTKTFTLDILPLKKYGPQVNHLVSLVTHMQIKSFKINLEQV
jgi:hypothetical protein